MSKKEQQKYEKKKEKKERKMSELKLRKQKEKAVALPFSGCSISPMLPSGVVRS